jgi:hypothetical protein
LSQKHRLIEAAGGKPARVKRDGYDDGAPQCVASWCERPPKQIAKWPSQIGAPLVLEANDGARYGAVIGEGRLPLLGPTGCGNDGAGARGAKRQEQPDGLVACGAAWRREGGSSELEGERQSGGHVQPIGAP